MKTNQNQLTLWEEDTQRTLSKAWDAYQTAGKKMAAQTEDLVCAAIRLGNKLITAKDEISQSHLGSWWEWLATNVPAVDPVQAANAIRLARHADKHGFPEGIKTLKAAMTLMNKAEQGEVEMQPNLLEDGMLEESTWVGKTLDGFFRKASRMALSEWDDAQKRDLKDRLTALKQLAARVGVI